MTKKAVLNILQNIFTSYGYNVTSSPISDIMAEKDDDYIYLKYEKEFNLNNIRHFADSVQKHKGKGLLVSDNLIDENLRVQALHQELTIWDRNELETQIGRAILSKASDENISTWLAPPADAPELPAPDQVPAREHDKNIRVILDSIPVNISKDDALSIGETSVGKAKSFRLEFIPFWRYIYSFNIRKHFKSKVIDLSGSGEKLINAITGGVSSISVKGIEVKDQITVPTQNYEILKPLLDKEDAFTNALDSIIREHSKEMRLNEMIGDTIVFENKIFAPDPEQINFEISLVYIPVWHIRGTRKSIQINAYDGHVLNLSAFKDADLI